MRKAVRWFKGLSKAGKAGVVAVSFIGLSAFGSATNGTHSSTTPVNKTSSNASTLQTTAQNATAQKQAVIEHKSVTTTEAIAFATTTQTSSSLAKGVTKIQVNGVNGVRTHVFDVVITDGVETSRTEVSNQVTTQPTNKVVVIGTYVASPQPSCPNGSYVNSSGNRVCSPYESPSAPAGATAECVDGSYSFSQHRSGTCSHHGGVSSWL